MRLGLTKAEEWFLYAHFVLKRSTTALPVLTKAFLSQPRQPPCAWHFTPKPTHLPLSHPKQNLSSKQIVSTGNMWPKLNDEYTCHQWLKIISSSHTWEEEMSLGMRLEKRPHKFYEGYETIFSLRSLSTKRSGLITNGEYESIFLGNHTMI